MLWIDEHALTTWDWTQIEIDEHGLVGVSRHLSPELVQAAYRCGMFPWLQHQQLFWWFIQQPRAVITPNRFRLPRSLRKTLRQREYLVSINRAFDDVIAACANVPRVGQDGSWISREFIECYTALHHQGVAHSFECWYPDDAGCLQTDDTNLRLAGGFYGVQIGRMFYGESMFSHENDASKIAFACALPYLAACGIELIDCQQDTDHMRRFGSHLLSFDDFHRHMTQLTQQPLCQAMDNTWQHPHFHRMQAACTM